MRWMRLGLSSDSTRLLVEACAADGPDSVRMRTNAPLCIGTMSCDFASCASEDFALVVSAPAVFAFTSAAFSFAPAFSFVFALIAFAPAATHARQRQTSAREVNLLLIAFTLPDNPDLHLVCGLEVLHVNAREIARRRARSLLAVARAPLPPRDRSRAEPLLLLDVDDARDDALTHDRHFDDLDVRRRVRCRVRRLCPGRVRRLRRDRVHGFRRDRLRLLCARRRARGEGEQREQCDECAGGDGERHAHLCPERASPEWRAARVCAKVREQTLARARRSRRRVPGAQKLAQLGIGGEVSLGVGRGAAAQTERQQPRLSLLVTHLHAFISAEATPPALLKYKASSRVGRWGGRGW